MHFSEICEMPAFQLEMHEVCTFHRSSLIAFSHQISRSILADLSGNQLFCVLNAFQIEMCAFH